MAFFPSISCVSMQSKEIIWKSNLEPSHSSLYTMCNKSFSLEAASMKNIPSLRKQDGKCIWKETPRYASNPSQKSKNKHKALDLKKHRKYLLLSVILVSSKFNHSGWKSLEKVSFCKNAKIHSGWNYNYKKSLILIIELCAKKHEKWDFF